MFTPFTFECVCVKHINIETWKKRNLIDNLSYLTLSILKDGLKLLTIHQKRNINDSDNFHFLIGNDLENNSVNFHFLIGDDLEDPPS